MKVKFISVLFFCIAVLACSLATLDKKRQLSLVFYKDSLAAYSGVLNSKTQITLLSFDTSAIKEVIKKNAAQYSNRLTLIIKPSPAGDGNVSEHLNLVKHISNLYQLTDSTTFALTDAEKKYFQSDERTNF